MWFQYATWILKAKPTVPDWKTEYRGHCTIHTGFFVRYGYGGCPELTVQGRVIEWPGLPTDVYLYNPPSMLRSHQHGSCLQLLKPGEIWFKLHWQRPAKDFGQSCAYVEQLLDEVA
jgi:hypothetical protein